MKVMVLGLDGATWDVLLPMIEQGRMKNLKRAMEMGSWGVLKSTLPPLSPVAWTSLATGKNPGKHGVLDFTRIHEGRSLPVDSKSIDSLTLWEILSVHDKKVGLVDVPMTYPPSRINGYMVTGMLTPKEAMDYTYPSALRDEIAATFGRYLADPAASHVKMGRSKQFLRELLYWAKKKEDVCQYLLNRYDWDFFMNVVRVPDLVQHWFYDALDPGHPDYNPGDARRYGPLLTAIYNACDQAIGNRLRRLDGDAILLIVSDHGFGPASQRFEVGRFLMDMGVLALTETEAWRRLIAGQADLSLIARLDFLDIRHRLLSTSSRIAAGDFLDRAFSAGTIDWSRTRAYCCLAGGLGIRVNLMGREPQGVVRSGVEYEEVRNLVRRGLKSLRDPKTHQRVMSEVYAREDIFNGPHLDEAPDVIFTLGEGPYLPRASLSARRVFEQISARDWRGDHRGDGIFVAAGSTIGSPSGLTICSIVDIAPTVLWAMGLPIPMDMDGVLIAHAFDQQFVAANPVRFEESAGDLSRERRPGYSREEEEEVLERLRKLGYL